MTIDQYLESLNKRYTLDNATEHNFLRTDGDEPVDGGDRSD